MPSWPNVELPRLQSFLDQTRSWTATPEIEELWNQVRQEGVLLGLHGNKALEQEAAHLRVKVKNEIEENSELLLRYDLAIAVLEKDGPAALQQAWTVLDDNGPLSTLTRPAK